MGAIVKVKKLLTDEVFLSLIPKKGLINAINGNKNDTSLTGPVYLRFKYITTDPKVGRCSHRDHTHHIHIHNGASY